MDHSTHYLHNNLEYAGQALPLSRESEFLQHALGGVGVGAEISPQDHEVLPPLTSQQIATITFESFRHSQNMPSFQGRLIKCAYNYSKERLSADAIRHTRLQNNGCDAL